MSDTTTTYTEPKPYSGTGQTDSGEVREKAREVADEASGAARDALHSASEAAVSQANSAKSSVAGEMSGIASALRTAAEEMRSGSPQERTFGQIAQGLADASEALQEKDLGTLVEDVSRFARGNPLVFLGSAALIGFAATRFAKASGHTGYDTPGNQTHRNPVPAASVESRPVTTGTQPGLHPATGEMR